MPARYDGFTAAEQATMDRAFQRLRQASSKARAALLKGDLTAYRKWFDTSGQAHLMKVATVVNEIDAAITSRPITFAKLDRTGVNVDTNGLCAYVFLIKAGKYHAHFGSGMRILVVWKTHAGDLNELVQTMYHELSHKVGSTHDHNYNKQTCAGYAINAPAKAVTNAENYNLFLREYM
jgi:hypothetical protein